MIFVGFNKKLLTMVKDKESTMNKTNISVALLLATGLIAGCSGDDGDAVVINQTVEGDTVNSNNTTTAAPEPEPETETAPAECSDADPNPAFVTINDNCEATVSGLIDEDYTFVNSVQYRLDGPVRVGAGNVTIDSQEEFTSVVNAGVTLTIEAGTDIRAFDDGTLYVTRGSKLIAEGTEAAPITFSSLDSGYDGMGEWGGVIIAGFAPQFGPGGTGACYTGDNNWCNVDGEGGAEVSSVFGGRLPADDSGTIKYVRIAEGGKVAGPNNEINGLTLQGVGHGTEISYVQVHNNLDDGVEWFGGTANLKYAVLTGNDDDDIDFDEGYQGNIQYAIVQKSNNPAPVGSNDPRGIEANSSDDEYVPETSAVLANVTVIGGAVNNNGDSAKGAQPGMRLRGSLTVEVHNTAVQNFDKGCIRIDDSDDDLDDSTPKIPSTVALQNSLNDCEGGSYQKRAADTEVNVQELPLSFSSTLAIQESEAVVGETVINAVENGSGFVFDQTDFVGAVDPDAGTGWWEGFSLPGTVRTTSDEFVAAPFVDYDADTKTAVLSGVIDRDYTLFPGINWQLDGPVRVGRGNVNIASTEEYQAVLDQGVTLTIRPGTEIRAFDDGTLYVTRGSKLNAVGTAAAPITFLPLDGDYTGLGKWGGVIIAGFAPQYGPGNTGACFAEGELWCNVEGEGGAEVASLFGGNVPADDSGSIKYVRMAGGGKVAGPNNEINGLTLQGVGWGTDLSYVQVHNNLDDGVEWFGGTVSATHLVLTGNDDDDIDFDEGSVINVQYAIVQKSNNEAPQGSNDPRGVEANSSDEDYVPQTKGVLANLHVQGGAVNNNADSSKGQQPGMRLRGSLTAEVHNTFVAGWDTGCIRIDDSDTNADDTVDSFSDVTLQDTRGNCGADNFYDKRAADAEVGDVGDDLDAVITATYAISGTAAATLTAPIASANPGADGDGFEFDQTDFVGAVDPDATVGWWEGWILEDTLRPVE